VLNSLFLKKEISPWLQLHLEAGV